MTVVQHDPANPPRYLPPLVAMGRSTDGKAAIIEAHAKLDEHRNRLKATFGTGIRFGAASLSMVLKFHDYEAWLMQEYSLPDTTDERAADDAYLMYMAEEQKYRQATEGGGDGQQTT